MYPDDVATAGEIEELLQFAIEGRKRVKDQILRIDTTMAAVSFGYTDRKQKWHRVTTLEEKEYTEYYQNHPTEGRSHTIIFESNGNDNCIAENTEGRHPEPGPGLFEGHRDFQENQRGVSYETLLLPYLRGATEITIVDPYIRLPHQGRNLVDLLALLALSKDPADEIAVTLVTKAVQSEYEHQHLLMLRDIQDSAAMAGIQLTVAWDESVHDRSIRTSTGWNILLGRGLDIFQKGSGSPYDLGARRQEFRQIVAFGITYINENKSS